MKNLGESFCSGSVPIGIYIHIPFCLSKCAYCDFLSSENASTQTQENYVKALTEEIRTARKGILAGAVIDTIYVGGGTPTALHSFLLCVVLQEARGLATGSQMDDIEFTVEANPGTLNSSYLSALRSCGVNRLSLGLQAWQDHLLRAIERAHTSDDFLSTFLTARDIGFDNMNIDIMFSLPGQTLAHLRETLADVIALSPEHISAYSLTPAEDTPLWSWLEGGQIRLPDERADREMYHEANQLLTDAGYIHYELSNFAKPSRESRHNVNCWRRRPYIGFGLGAHSFDGKSRWHNETNMAAYLHNPHTFVGIEALSEADAMAEMMFLGLRLSEGISDNDFFRVFGVKLTDRYGTQIKKLIKDGLLAREADRLFLTSYGADLANRVFQAFI